MPANESDQLHISANGAPDTPPPVYFLSLTVGNFRCFGPKQTLDLSDGNGRPARWTVLLGDNGVGKTTLLQCLALLQPAPMPAVVGGAEVFVPRIRDTHSFRLFSWLYEKRNAPNPFFLDATIYHGATLEGIGEPIQIDHVGLGQQQASLVINPFPIEKNVQGLICYGYGATRRMRRTSLVEWRDPDASASLFSTEIELINAEEWLLQAHYATRLESISKYQQRRAIRRLRQVRAVLVRLLPDFDVNATEACRFVPSSEGEISTRVEVKTPYGWVHIQDLSLGQITVISWIVDLASRLFDRYPNSKDPLAEPAVVLVDEIDLHLHPKWQRTIMNFLIEIFPNTQFIVTAHSPLIVQAATDANIILLRREGDHVVIDNDVEAIANWRVDQVLTSDLFGLESARPPQLDEELAERNRILSKSKLTKADEKRLKELEAQIGHLPTGETPADIEAMDIIRRAAELLTK